MLGRSTKQPGEAQGQLKSSGERKNPGGRRRLLRRRPEDRNIHGGMAESGRPSHEEPPTTPSGTLQDHSSSPPPSTQPRYQQTFANTEAHGRSVAIQVIAGMATRLAHRHRDATPAHEAVAKENHVAKSQNHIVQEFQVTETGPNSRNFQILELDNGTIPFTQKYGNTTVGQDASSVQGAMSPEVIKILAHSQPVQIPSVQHAMSILRHDEVRENLQVASPRLTT